MSYPILYGYAHYPAVAGIAVAGITVVGDTTARQDGLDMDKLGFGVLSDAISCEVTEERNGIYELAMKYPLTGVHFSEIELRDFLVAKPNYTDDPQIFRIYKITKPLNGVCTVYAQHISYDLSGFIAPAGLTGASLTLALNALEQYSGKFKLQTTASGSATFTTDVPASVRSWFGGKTGSILDLYGGEWHFDNYTCTLSTARGTDRGVTIRYGKNLTALTQNTDCSAICSEVIAYYSGFEDGIIQSEPVYTGLALDVPKTLLVDASQKFKEPPSVADLTDYARQYAENNDLVAPKINITLDFAQLKGLTERVDLCDTVTIQFEALGISATAKCIKTVWDCLKERYTSSTFGNARSTFSDAISATAETVVRENKSWYEAAASAATALITGNKGGFVVFHDTDDDGKPDEILVMDTEDINTAVKVWRWNKSGLGYSSTGYDGPYGLAMTIDGQIVANFITAGELNADIIKTGIITSANGKVFFDLDDNELHCDMLVSTGAYGSNYVLEIGRAYFVDANGSRYPIDGALVHATGSSTQALAIIPGDNSTPTQLMSGFEGLRVTSRVQQGGGARNTGTAGVYVTPNGYVGVLGQHASAISGQSVEAFIENASSNLANLYGLVVEPQNIGSGTSYQAAGRVYVMTMYAQNLYPTNLTVSGTKSRVFKTEDYSNRLLYCYETPSPMFGDIGEGTIGENGTCYVWIESIFAETINTMQYQVSLQKYGEGDCYVAERHGSYFVVKGTAGLDFGWELKAKQADFTQRRLDKDNMFTDISTHDYGTDAYEYIALLKEGRLSA